MKTLNDIVDGIFIKEGDRYAVVDQPTGRGGITLATFQQFADANWLGRRVTTVDLAALAHNEARTVIQWLLGDLSREMGLDAVTFEPLKLQLLDFGYNSGGPRALRWLQRVIDVPRTGRMDVATTLSLSKLPSRLVHQALIAARLQMVDMATDKGGSVAQKYEEGLENRALSFSLLTIP